MVKINKRDLCWAFGLGIVFNRTSHIEIEEMLSVLNQEQQAALETGYTEGVSLMLGHLDQIRVKSWARCKCPRCERVRVLPFCKSDTCPTCGVKMDTIMSGNGSDEEALILTRPPH